MSITEHRGISLGVILCYLLKKRRVVFGFALGLWSISNLVLSHLSSVRYGFHLVQQALSQIRPHLVTPARFVPPLPFHILQAGQMIDRQFFVGVNVYFSLLVAFRVTFQVIDSRKWG